MAATPLPLTLDRTSGAPLGAQVAAQVRDLVLGGTLARGDRLPSSRALAADLGVSRSVTEQAWEQLLAEGWVETRHGSGTYVASGAGGGRPRPRPAPVEPVHDLVTLDTGTPWIDARHRAGWRRAWREVSAAVPPRGYGDRRGLPELREAVAAHLARTRGLDVSADDVLVTGGTTDGLRQLLGALPPGDVGVEDPGYRSAVATVRSVGRGVRDLPAGAPVGPDDLAGLAATYVTPAHQHPLGLVMPAADRLALLAAARAAGTMVVEDDYDSEFRYDVAPVPALAALDPGVVAYLGTASKSVAPTLRLGWLVGPADLVAEVAARREDANEAPTWPSQRALLAMLRDGHVDKVVRTARRVYGERAPRVAAALSPWAEAAASPAGMYSTWLVDQPAALRARERARAAGFEVNLLSDYCRSSTLTGLVVGFGGVTDAELDRALEAVVDGLSSGGSGGR